MSEANQLRLVASEIICKLHEAGEMTHLELLQAHAQRAIEEMQKLIDPDAKWKYEKAIGDVEEALYWAEADPLARKILVPHLKRIQELIEKDESEGN